MNVLPADDERTYWIRVGVLTIVWTILLVIASIVLIVYGGAITEFLF